MRDSESSDNDQYRRKHRESSFSDALEDPLKFRAMIDKQLDHKESGEMQSDLKMAANETKNNRKKDKKGNYLRNRL